MKETVIIADDGKGYKLVSMFPDCEEKLYIGKRVKDEYGFAILRYEDGKYFIL